MADAGLASTYLSGEESADSGHLVEIVPLITLAKCPNCLHCTTNFTKNRMKKEHCKKLELMEENLREQHSRELLLKERMLREEHGVRVALMEQKIKKEHSKDMAWREEQLRQEHSKEIYLMEERLKKQSLKQLSQRKHELIRENSKQSSIPTSLIVGKTEKCSEWDVIQAMKDTKTLEVVVDRINLWKIARELEAPREYIRSLEKRVVSGSSTSTYALYQILEIWAARNGENATLESFLDVLDKLELTESFNALQSAFFEER